MGPDPVGVTAVTAVVLGIAVDQQSRCGGGLDPRRHPGVRSREREDRSIHRRQQIEIGRPGGADRADPDRQTGMEQRDEPRHPFDVDLHDRVSAIETDVGSGESIVVDLHRDDRSLGDRGRGRQPRQGGHAVEGRARLVRRPDRYAVRVDGDPARARVGAVAGVGSSVLERGDARVGHAVHVDHEVDPTQCEKAHVAICVGLDDQPVRSGRRNPRVVVQVGAVDSPGLVDRYPLLAGVGGDVAGVGHPGCGQLADHRLAADRFGDVDPQRAACGDGSAAEAGVGSPVVERGDPRVGDAVDIDHQLDAAEGVEADVTVAVGLDDQSVRAPRRDSPVVVEVRSIDVAGDASRNTAITCIGGDESGATGASRRQLSDHRLGPGRLRDVHPKRAAGGDRSARDPGVGSTVRKGRDAGVERDRIHVDDHLDRTQRVEADVAEIVGLDDQPVRPGARHAPVVVQVRTAHLSGTVEWYAVGACVGGDVARLPGAGNGELSDHGLATFGSRHVHPERVPRREGCHDEFGLDRRRPGAVRFRVGTRQSDEQRARDEDRGTRQHGRSPAARHRRRPGRPGLCAFGHDRTLGAIGNAWSATYSHERREAPTVPWSGDGEAGVAGVGDIAAPGDVLRPAEHRHEHPRLAGHVRTEVPGVARGVERRVGQRVDV